MRHPLMAPHANFPCVGDDRWVSIAVRTQEEWEAFSEAIGNPAWTSDPRFADAYSRSQHLRELNQEIGRWTRERTAEDVSEVLQQAGVGAVPVMNIEDQFTNPHFQEREAFAEVEHPRIGAEWMPGNPWQLSDSPGKVSRAAPLLGEHNRYVFQELLGYVEEAFLALENGGVLTCGRYRAHNPRTLGWRPCRGERDQVKLKFDVWRPTCMAKVWFVGKLSLLHLAPTAEETAPAAHYDAANGGIADAAGRPLRPRDQKSLASPWAFGGRLSSSSQGSEMLNGLR